MLTLMFLVGELPAWYRNHLKRLVKAPKTHMTDTRNAKPLLRGWKAQQTCFCHGAEQKLRAPRAYGEAEKRMPRSGRHMRSTRRAGW